MARERWTVDGYEITEGVVRDVEYRAGLYRTPQVDGTDGEVSNRTGRLWRPKVHGPGSFTLAVWLGSTSRAVWEPAWDELLRAFVHPHRLSTYERTLADGTIRRCQGDVVASIDPQPSGSLMVRAGIEVAVPAGYWEGTVARTAGGAFTVAAASASIDVVLTPYARSTAAMEYLTYRITGPGASVRVADWTDGVEGDFLLYAATVAAGQVLVINSGTWAVTGEGGLVPNQAALQYSGRRFLPVAAARPGQTPKVRITASNVTTATRLDVLGRDAYLM